MCPVSAGIKQWDLCTRIINMSEIIQASSWNCKSEISLVFANCQLLYLTSLIVLGQILENIRFPGTTIITNKPNTLSQWLHIIATKSKNPFSCTASKTRGNCYPNMLDLNQNSYEQKSTKRTNWQSYSNRLP